MNLKSDAILFEFKNGFGCGNRAGGLRKILCLHLRVATERVRLTVDFDQTRHGLNLAGPVLAPLVGKLVTHQPVAEVRSVGDERGCGGSGRDSVKCGCCNPIDHDLASLSRFDLLGELEKITNGPTNRKVG